MRGVRYTVDHDGRLVMPVMAAMLDSVDTVLFLPEMVDDATEVQVTLDPFNEKGPGGAIADRWRIHHGDPPDVYWAHAIIDAARHNGSIFDGEALTQPNVVAAAEPAICRWLNSEHRDDLPRLAAAYSGIRSDAPVAVGLDPDGLNLRGRFDVLRVPFAEPVATEEEARAAITTLLAHADDSEAEDEAPTMTAGEELTSGEGWLTDE